MRTNRSQLVLIAIAACLVMVVSAGAQDDSKSDKPSGMAKLRIEVTAGEKNKPVESASVYVRYVEERALRKDKKIEMNVKTNKDGVVRVPDVPKGKVLIQVIAEGWKTFGRWYDITGDEEVIQIKLEKPPRWY